MKKVFWIFAIAASLVSPLIADEEPTVVPGSERELAQQKGMQGPTKNMGIKSVKSLGAVDLGGDFAALKGRQLRAREIVIAPGGVVAVHEHDSRPGVAYILSGEVFEHRNDADEPIQRTVGAVAFEKTGVTHWWENKSSQDVKALVVDIFPVPN